MPSIKTSQIEIGQIVSWLLIIGGFVFVYGQMSSQVEMNKEKLKDIEDNVKAVSDGIHKLDSQIEKHLGLHEGRDGRES